MGAEDGHFILNRLESSNPESFVRTVLVQDIPIFAPTHLDGLAAKSLKSLRLSDPRGRRFQNAAL